MSASPAASYGLATMLYGTLLPAPDIGKRKEAVARMREAEAAGHECGVHAWDHVDWHDRLPGMARDEVVATFGRAAERFEEVFGRAARVAGAPGWTANGLSVEAYEGRGIRVASDTRGGAPFRPLRADGTPAGLVEVPSTLPTLDELLAFEEFRGARRDGRSPSSNAPSRRRGERASTPSTRRSRAAARSRTSSGASSRPGWPPASRS